MLRVLLSSAAAFALTSVVHAIAVSEPIVTTDALNLIPVPLCRQATDYTCGASALQAVFGFYGEGLREGEVAHACGSTESDGTKFTRMAAYARKKGFRVEHAVNMTLEQLRKKLSERTPVICLIQAWAEKKVNYATDWNDGHYVVAVGMDSKNVYFMDPSTLGNYAYIPISEFEKRWHDTEKTKKLNHFGMMITKQNSKYAPNEVKKLL